MIKSIRNKNKQNGYAILFAVVIVSIVSLLAIGLSNTSYKQIVLSSLAKDSQVAFFQADTATECALYADSILEMTSDSPSPWYCGLDTFGNDNSFNVSILSGGGSGFELNPDMAGSTNPCFEISVSKGPTDPIVTTIKARGYNNCDKTSPKTVQREIEVNY